MIRTFEQPRNARNDRGADVKSRRRAGDLLNERRERNDNAGGGRGADECRIVGVEGVAAIRRDEDRRVLDPFERLANDGSRMRCVEYRERGREYVERQRSEKQGRRAPAQRAGNAGIGRQTQQHAEQDALGQRDRRRRKIVREGNRRREEQGAESVGGAPRREHRGCKECGDEEDGGERIEGSRNGDVVDDRTIRQDRSMSLMI